MARFDDATLFTTVIRSGSLSGAARELGITPSAVSRQLSALEARLGVRLLNRSTRRSSPTEAGQLYYERARRLLEELDDVETLVGELDAAPRGTLRLAAQPLFGRAILARVLADFQARYRELDVELTVTDRTLEGLGHDYEVSIHLGPVADGRFVARAIARPQMTLCASPGYLAEAGTPAQLEALDGHDVVRVVAAGLGSGHLDPTGNHILPTRPRRQFVVNDLDTGYHAVLTGMGIGLLPLYLIRRHVANGRLVQLFPERVAPSEPVYVVYPEARLISSRARAFVDFMLAYFSATSRVPEDPSGEFAATAT